MAAEVCQGVDPLVREAVRKGEAVHMVGAEVGAIQYEIVRAPTSERPSDLRRSCWVAYLGRMRPSGRWLIALRDLSCPHLCPCTPTGVHGRSPVSSD